MPRIQSLLAHWGQLLAFLRHAITALPKASWRESLRQAGELGYRSFPFVFLIMAFTGGTLVLLACVQAKRVVGDLSPVGPAFAQLVAREFGPTIVALMVAARYGAGVGAELGAMKISEQIDALRLMGASPTAYIVAPRLWAGLIAMVPLAVLGSVVAHAFGGLAAHHLFGLSWSTYLGTGLISGADVTVGVCKALAYGICVPWLACHAGLGATGGAPGVGRAATRAVIGSSIAILAADLYVGVLAFGVEKVVGG